MVPDALDCNHLALSGASVRWLRKHGTPEDLIKLWLGHAEESTADSYNKVKDDLQYRQKEAERIGIGFEISPIVRTVRTFQNVVAV